MEALEKVIVTDANHSESFANKIEKPYGEIFYNAQIPESFDANHAVFFKPCEDYNAAIEEIICFYKSKSLTPRVYTYGVFETEQLEKALTGRFSKREVCNATVMKLCEPSNIQTRRRLEIKSVCEFTREMAENVFMLSQREYMTAVLNGALKNKNYKLYCGFLSGEAVTIAGIWFSPYGTVRIDNIQTGIWFRSCGFAHEIINYIVKMLRSEQKAIEGEDGENHFEKAELSTQTVFLTTDNPAAQRIYEKAGFAPVSQVKINHYY